MEKVDISDKSIAKQIHMICLAVKITALEQSTMLWSLGIIGVHSIFIIYSTIYRRTYTAYGLLWVRLLRRCHSMVSSMGSSLNQNGFSLKPKSSVCVLNLTAHFHLAVTLYITSG